MVKDFNQLPADAQERIKVRITYADALSEVQDYAEKADFIMGELQGDYDMLDSPEELLRWRIDRNRVLSLIRIARDYTFQLVDQLEAVNQQIDRNTDADRSGGGYRRCLIIGLVRCAVPT
ncbi:MAG: hypothetical protein ACRDBO_06125 [Lachnospiraceae bacterium]